MNKVWFITGAARGLGAAIAKAALADGDRVVVSGRRIEPLENVFAEYGERVMAVALDVTDEAQALAAVETAVARFGRIDVLVNNAGYGQLAPFEDNFASDAAQQFATNVFGVFNVCRAVLPVMRQQRSGRVFNVSSMGGMVGMGGAALYCASKFAVEGFSESLVQEVTQFGIKVTLVEPGVFRTDFLDPQLRGLRYPRAGGLRCIHRQGQKRFGRLQPSANRQPGETGRCAGAPGQQRTSTVALSGGLRRLSAGQRQAQQDARGNRAMAAVVPFHRWRLGADAHSLSDEAVRNDYWLMK